MIRKPIVTVLGHVDHGKTRYIDRIRGTALADREAGNITQHIGATEVPIQVVQDIAGELLKKFKFDVNIPGLLFIDTPGHEAFTNLRKRGGSIADMAVLIIDITQGLQPQTIEAIKILQNYKTPFIVGLNKIDKLQDWNSVTGSFLENLGKQSDFSKKQLDEKLYEIVGELHSHGFNAERFDRVDDFTKQVPIVPISAVVGEGIPETLMLLAGLSQKFLADKLEIHPEENAHGVVLEVKEEKGLGATVDAIIYDGSLKVNEEIVVGGTQGLISAKVRALLEPKPLSEMRDPKNKFDSIQKVTAAAGVKISAPGLDCVLAGSPLIGSPKEGEKDSVQEEIESIKIESKDVGVILKADALGSLEALTDLMQKEGVKIRKADVGKVSKTDVLEAVPIKEKDPYLAVVFAFNSGMEENALEEAKLREIKIFKGNVIYSLIEDYQKWVKESKERKKLEKEKKLVYPVKVKVLKDHIFRNSNPAVVGVKVLAGRLRSGVELMKKGKVIGEIESLQLENEKIEEAKLNDEVAVSIKKAVAEKDFNEEDELYSFIPNEQFGEIEKYLEIGEGEKALLQEIKRMEEEK